MGLIFKKFDYTPAPIGGYGSVNITLDGLTTDVIPYDFLVGYAGANPTIRGTGMNNPGISLYDVPAGEFMLFLRDAKGVETAEGMTIQTVLPNGVVVPNKFAVIDYLAK